MAPSFYIFLLLQQSKQKGDFKWMITPTSTPRTRWTSRSYLIWDWVVKREASLKKPHLTRNDTGCLLAGACSPLALLERLLTVALSERSRHRLEKSTLWLYLRSPSNDFFHSPLSILSKKNPCSPQGGADNNKNNNTPIYVKTDKSMIFWVPTNTMISVLPLQFFPYI